MTTGSNWTKMVTAKTGRKDGEEQDDTCDLCKAKETSDHVWHCEALKGKRRELDVDLAEAGPEEFTPAMRQGVACAMNADPTKTFWGMECKECWGDKKRWNYGCTKPGYLSTEVGGLVEK